ncbi:hypothetical protein JZ751_010673, partial [Albula glossodonta]
MGVRTEARLLASSILTPERISLSLFSSPCVRRPPQSPLPQAPLSLSQIIRDSGAPAFWKITVDARCVCVVIMEDIAVPLTPHVQLHAIDKRPPPPATHGDEALVQPSVGELDLLQEQRAIPVLETLDLHPHPAPVVFPLVAGLLPHLEHTFSKGLPLK